VLDLEKSAEIKERMESSRKKSLMRWIASKRTGIFKKGIDEK